MKTEVAPAKAANLSLADLSKALSPTKPAPAPKTEDESETVTEEAPEAEDTREVPPGETAESEGDESADLSQTDANAEAAPEAETEPAEAGDEAATEADAPTTTVAESVRQHLATELAPLIADLNKAGAKGALQVLLKRLPKVTDQRDSERNKRLAAESRVTELETELQTTREEAEAPRTAPSRQPPQVARLNQTIAEVDGFINLFSENPDGLEMPDGANGPVSFTAREVARHLEQLRNRRQELVAERIATQKEARTTFQTQFRQVHQHAARLYPWLDQPDAPEQTRMKALLKSMPGLEELPDHELIVARYFRGKAAEEAEAKGKTAAGAKKAPPARTPTQVSTGTPASKAGPANAKTKAQKDVAEAEAKFKQSGSRNDLQRVEVARRRLARLPE